MPYKKGQSGNPGGRPKKGETFTDILRALGNKKDYTYEGNKITRKEGLANKVWEKALADNPDMFAVKLIYDRADGKAVETRVLSDPEGNELKIKVELVE